MNTTLLRLLTDFNSADEAEAVVLLEDAQIVPTVDEWVRLVDEDGNHCEGIVLAIANDLIYVKPLWQTWREADTVAGGIADLMEALRVSVQQAQADRAGNREPTNGSAQLLDVT